MIPIFIHSSTRSTFEMLLINGDDRSTDFCECCEFIFFFRDRFQTNNYLQTVRLIRMNLFANFEYTFWPRAIILSLLFIILHSLLTPISLLFWWCVFRFKIDLSIFFGIVCFLRKSPPSLTVPTFFNFKKLLNIGRYFRNTWKKREIKIYYHPNDEKKWLRNRI